ncbi:MAG: right-handed parallel beta-helix repeat-containing protein [Cetobacterium sp.]
MNNNFKNDKFVEVVQEFQIVQGQSVYQIGSIDLKDVYFFVKNGNENYKVLATGQYAVDGANLTINDPDIILTNTHIQVCRVYSTVASKYISDVVNINTLREHYNVLVDDFINVIDFLRKSGIKSDSSAMNYVFPLLEEGQVFMRKGLGFEGRQIMDINGELQLQINKAVEIFEKYLNEQKKPEIDNYIGAKETELESRLEIFTQEKIQQINDVGLKLEISQTNHGFLFDAVQYDASRGIYIKASAAYGADGMAVRINSNKFYLVSNGLVKVPDLAVDSSGRAYVMDEFYFLDNYTAGGCTPEKPTNIFQPLFCIVDKDGVKSALIQVDTPMDLEPREITELGLPNKENTIQDLINSRKYSVGDIVQVLGYYTAGDGAGHPRQKKPTGYIGADAVIGADGSIWGIVNNGEVRVSWLGGDFAKAVDSFDEILIDRVCIVDKKIILNNKSIKSYKKMFLDCSFNFEDFIEIQNDCVVKNLTLKLNNRNRYGICITGDNNKVDGVRIYNPTKADFVPTPPNYIKYNQGSIRDSGNYNEITGSEFFNNEGAGIYVSGAYGRITNNKIHDNVSGIILDNGSLDYVIDGNVIYNNDPIKTEGADGILSKCTNVVITNNTISRSGEHGMYIQGANSVVTKNIVGKCHHVGIKYSNVKNGVIANNIVNDNCTVGNSSNESQIYLQWGCDGIIIDSNVNNSNASNCFFIRTVEKIGSELKNIKIINNIGLERIVVNGTENFNIFNNICDEILLGSFSTVNQPTNCKIKDNRVNKLNLLELVDSEISGNTCEEIVLKFDKLTGNKIINNKITNQISQIDTRTFVEFSDNDISSTLNVPLFTATAKRDNIKINKNKFTLTKAQRGIYEPTSGLSGDSWEIKGNRIAGSVESFCNYGNGHIITENFAQQGSLGYFGCSNSIVSFNQGSVSFRSGVTGNYSQGNIPLVVNVETLEQLDTPYHATQMSKLGILDDYHNYLTELHEYEKSQNVQSDSGVMNLNVIQPPVIPTEVEAYAKEYNLI